jgi:acetyl-CoA/propionyl-CoA carboxylase, biotin carboxylase, biotin carboxyl carrier protein
MFRRVLVANRGEIAIRVFRTLREMGIASVGVYSEVDRDALFVRHADEARLIGPGPASESYLVIDRVVETALAAGAEAIHPGYGFLAENAAFARACAEAGLVFIGPPPEAIEAMGSKIAARALMHDAGVPIVPGVRERVPSLAAARRVARQIGYPVAVKAAAGGGGKGFRVALAPGELAEAFEGAAREAERFFADSEVYLERYLPEPRHVEIQILADGHGNAIWLGERDCSVQRRHQKLIEETPSPVVSADLRRRMGEASVRAAKAVGYRSAGTLEYLVAGDEFFFLEMNTRIQVEHTITEEVCGVDLVREQVRIAAGEPLSLRQRDVRPRGHAFECRINAEDATNRFLPSPARITAYREPGGPGVRIDSGVEAGSDIPDIYDPMVAKLIVRDVDRETARRRMIRALDEYVIEGPRTLIPFHRWLLEQEEFIAGGACHAMLAELSARATPIPALGRAGVPTGEEAPGAPERVERRFVAEVGGKRFDVRLFMSDDGLPARRAPAPRRRRRERSPDGHFGGGDASGDTIASPMQGTVLRVLVEPGAEVAAGDVIVIVEAMKMENEVSAHRAGIVRELAVAEGQAVQADQVIAVLG